MHPVIVDNLEEYLAGTLAPVTQRQVDTHLADCEGCRVEVGGMREMAELFGSLRPNEAVVPSASFTARVMMQVGSRPAPGFWSVFSLDFGRRVIFASLLTLAVLGSYLVSRERQYAPGPTDPDMIMATGQGSAPGQARDQMLVTLTSYEP